MDTQGPDSNFLLALPLSIRQRVYAYLGFQRLKRVNLNAGLDDSESVEYQKTELTPFGVWSSRRQQFNQRPPPRFNCPDHCLCYWCYPLSNQLFYVSSAISQDAISIFYSRNQFRIADRDRCGLLALDNLGPTALGSLRWISVRLDTKKCGGAPCHGATFEGNYWTPEKDVINPRKLQIISKWAGFCVRLAAYIKPYQLDLHVICGAYDTLTAESFLFPLLNLPTLKHCSIRLGPFDDSPLQKLTERIVAQTTQYTQHAESTRFQFPDLPTEIQIHVLKHTELIAPFPLTWKANSQFASPLCEEFVCAANPTGEEASYCPSTHTAYSSIHRCWRNPISLFQVSHQIRQQAQYIFYSQNQFHITVDPWSLLPSPDPEISSNIKSLKPFPRDCLQHLRYIELAFTDELEAHFASPEQSGHPDWINILDIIAQNSPLPRLTIALKFGWEASCRFFGLLGNYESKNLNCYEQIVKPMARLEGLKDYFIHLSWPTGTVDENRKEYEQRLEKLVMGDSYDSFARGKVFKKTRPDFVPTAYYLRRNLFAIAANHSTTVDDPSPASWSFNHHGPVYNYSREYSIMANQTATIQTTTTPFAFPQTYSFPPFFTPQPNTSTRASQLQKWSSLIQSWCRHHRIYRLSLIDAIDSPLFHNATLRKRLGLGEARAVLDWMARPEEDGGGGRRAEWVDGGDKTVVWVWWRRPEEWAGLLVDWVENTGQKNTVLTVYELIQGEGTTSQEWHGMDQDVMFRSLSVLVKRGKAQVFGSEGQEGVKFF